MFPYFYPTTVALIDDDARFLQAFDDCLSRDFVTRRFSDAQSGLNHLITEDATAFSRVARLSGYLNTTPERHEVDVLQQLLTAHVGQLRGQADRFSSVSVAVIDLNMPDIDGMMICRALRRRPVRTILLSGEATERVALRAFNEGLIDRFVSKHDPNVVGIVSQHLRDLQKAYFRRMTTTIRDALTLRSLAFLTDGAFLRNFNQICEERQIVEYYVRAQPPGVELVRADGRSWTLLALDEHEVNRRIRAAEAAGADAEMLAQMRSGRIVTQFPSEGGLYEPRFRQGWQLYAFDAKPIIGTGRWLTTVVQPTAIRPMGLRDFVSFESFMRSQRPH